MRHAENLRLTGKAVTAAVAAALLAMASGAGAGNSHADIHINK